MNCKTTSLVWFREDLRLHDNSALFAASRAKAPIIGIYLFDPQAWQAHDTAPARIAFMLGNLSALQTALAQKNIPLLLLEVTASATIPALFTTLARELHATHLYFNEQYEINEQQRDAAVTAQWRQAGNCVKRFTDQVIFGPNQLLTQTGSAFRVFTPYKQAFLRALANDPCAIGPLPAIKKQEAFALSPRLKEQCATLAIWHDRAPEQWPGFVAPFVATYWPCGEAQAQARLQDFLAEKIRDYHQQRDFPALHGTSTLSPYLANGVLSVRQVMAAAWLANQPANEGATCWLSELIWRDFYKQVLWAFPRVSKHQAFKPATDTIVWRSSPQLFDAWCQGQTGFPFIDAGMRQLNQTGWMHNRLRMVVAMFLSKDCFIDWRQGEQYFMRHLIDGDLSANNGGWQWSASTGTDAAPYFRIFNPIAQSQKFDPTGEFIKTYCPELNHLSAKEIHTPWRLASTVRDKINYPQPIVDRTQTKARVLNAFSAITPLIT